jgi:hypothetical protein
VVESDGAIGACAGGEIVARACGKDRRAEETVAGVAL